MALSREDIGDTELRGDVGLALRLGCRLAVQAKLYAFVMKRALLLLFFEI